MWFTHNLWAGLACVAAAGSLVAALSPLLWDRSRSSAGEGGEGDVAILQKRQRFLLFCGDAKALADLAIQRNMINREFLRHLQLQPCYDALVPLLGEHFLSMVALHETDARGSALAMLFRKEIERLERE